MLNRSRQFAAFIGLLFGILGAGCSAAPTASDSVNTGGQPQVAGVSEGDAAAAGFEQEEDPSGSGEGSLESGTITGNPVPKPIRQIILKTKESAPEEVPQADNALTFNDPEAATTSGTESETASDDPFASAVAESFSYCKPFPYEDIVFPGVLACRATPSFYHLGVRELAFVTCAASDGAETACGDGAAQIAGTETIFMAEDGAIERMEIDDAGMDLSFETEGAGGIRAGGLHFTVAYIEQRLPDESSDPEEAGKIMPKLRGMSYRICTASQDAGPEALAAYCGQAEAKMGDVLWDADADGVFGFMLPNKGEIIETSTRSGNYDAMMNVLRVLEKVTRTKLDPLVSGDAFMPLLAGFDTVAQAAAEEDFSATVSFDVTGTFRFVDGHVRVLKCIQAGDIGSCLEENNDPLTSGWYHPRFDTFLPDLPEIEVTF